MDKFQNIKPLMHLVKNIKKSETQVLRKISSSSPGYYELL
jgi:hypothetical protein